MRHRRKFNHLSRTSAHRKAMLANMASSLIIHKRIKTTLAKAKALRSFVEPLITRSKEDSTHSRRMVFRYLQNKDAVKELFREISVKSAERPGGYTRILKLGPRLGDNAEMCLIELVDFNEYLLGERDARKAKTTRRGRRTGKKKTELAEGGATAAAGSVAAASADVEVAEPVQETAEEAAAAVEESTGPEAKVEDKPVEAEEKPEVTAETREEGTADGTGVKAEEDSEEPEAKKED